MYSQDAVQIQEVIQAYFEGIHKGDVEKLGEVFHPKSALHGDIKGDPYYSKLEDYLETVRQRQSPDSLGEKNRMKILSLEIVNNIAYAKLHVPMYAYNYYDYLALCKSNGNWKIVNKIFTHVGSES